MINELSWAPEQVNESLAAIYDHATASAKAAVDWYLQAKNRVAMLASLLRFLAILSISIGAVGPLVCTVWSLNVQPFSSPLSATLFAVLAATFIGIDRALGISSRHMRFVAASFDIQKLASNFRLTWHTKMADLGSHSATMEDVRSLLQMAIAFEESVWSIIQKETAEGRAESEKSLLALQAQADKIGSKRK